MSQRLLRGQPLDSAPQVARMAFHAMLVLGVVVVVTMGGNLAFQAIDLDPQPQVKAKEPATTSGEVIARRAGGASGALVICGGGMLPDTVRDRFFELAGGPKARIVVIPTASPNADQPSAVRVLELWKRRGAASVQMLHTRSPERANDADFVKPLREATGVWIGGGDQVLLSKAYVGTEVERQLKSVLDRGGVVGGTSAGAAIMTRVMIANGRTKAHLSQGFDFLQGAVVDQHFLRRNRMERLLGVLSSHPELIGLGIDEQTALVVEVREHHLSVIGNSYVVACVPDRENRQPRLQFLKPGDQTDLALLKTPTVTAVAAQDL